MQIMKAPGTSNIHVLQNTLTHFGGHPVSARLALRESRWVLLLFLVLASMVSSAVAQFSGSIQGVITDSSGAVMPAAQVTLLSLDKAVTRIATSDGSGVYRFPSLAPGNYRLTATAQGFSKGETTVVLSTNETRDVSLTLGAEGATQGVTVTTEAPLLNTAETRNQLTLDKQAFDNLPLPGRNFVTLIALAPGVSGRGTSTDNFNTEAANDVSANGRGANGNLYVIDGLDITSSVRPGVTNLTPNPDSVAEVAIQTNTFNVDYGRASSIQTSITTKSGSDQYHGFASDYFTYQKLRTYTHFARSYRPYHSNNISAGIGGPIVPNHEAFFFFSIEPLRSVAANDATTVTFEDPAFIQFAKTAFPNTVGTSIISNYGVQGVANTVIYQTAAQQFPVGSAQACGTASTGFLPCNTPVLDQGQFSSSAFRNAVQYNVRLDKYFSKDRLYGTVYRQHLDTGAPNPRPSATTNNTSQTQAYQVNETHTFSPNTLNEASAAYLRVEGENSKTGDFKVPSISVGSSSGYGVGFAQGDFIQTNYHWRDVFTHIVGSHSLRFGFDGVYYTGDALFGTVHNQPSFNFNNILDLVKDNPLNQGSLSYDPVTGKPSKGDYGYGTKTYGGFVEDAWKISRRATLNFGIRYDDFGNPYGRDGLKYANFFPGDGSTFDQQVASGSLRVVDRAYKHSVRAIAPRAGFAYDIFGDGKSTLHGGIGLYHDGPTLGQGGDVFNGNPPNYVVPTFFSDGSTAKPIFALGTSSTTPGGFPYPAFVGKPLNAQGGITGAQINIGGIDRDTKASNTINYALTIERQLSAGFVATVGYVGSVSNNLVTGGGSTTSTIYGTDVNRFNGDLFQQKRRTDGSFRTSPNRLNSSFGAITYGRNLAHSNYSALVTSLKGRITSRGFVTASYTYSRSMDNWNNYPVNDIEHFYSRSNWDVPNRFSLGYSYILPGLKTNALVESLTGGFTLAGTTILQQGQRYSVFTNNSFRPTFDAAGNIVGLDPRSGDFNGDGNNNDFPNILNSDTKRDRQSYLNGVFQSCAGNPFGTVGSPCGNFSLPALGQEGNELPNSFRNPGFAQWDVDVKKVTKLTERVAFDLRLDIFNVFNRVNLYGVDGNANSGTFGRSTRQYTPRNMVIGGRLNF